jgi:hypothetical protein
LTIRYLLAGAGLLLLGLFMARRTLPEWQVPPRPSRESVQAVRRALENCGATTGDLRLRLRHAPAYPSIYERAFRLLGEKGPEYVRRSSGFSAWTVSGDLRIGNAPVGRIDVSLDASGRIRQFESRAEALSLLLREPSPEDSKARDDFSAKFLDLLSEGEGRGPETRVIQSGGNTISRVWPLAGRPGQPREWLTQTVAGTNVIVLGRELADSSTSAEGIASRKVGRALSFVAFFGVLALTVMVTLGVLLFRRRLSFRIAIVLGALSLASALLSGSALDVLTRAGGWISVVFFVGGLANSAFLVALWAVAESLLRDSVPGFRTSLDALSAGRLGPRAGQAILCGLGIGAGIAGSRFVLLSSAGMLTGRGVFPQTASFSLPFFSFMQNPFVEGIYLAGAMVFFAAALRRLLSKEIADPLAVVAVALINSMAVPIHPWGASLVLTLVEGVFLLFAFRKFGLTGLLVTALSSYLFRDFPATYAYLPQNLMPFVIAFVSLLSVMAAGFVALGRREEIDEEKLGGPEYVRKLEKERRVKYEMDLLSRMQLALLPDKPPLVKGLDIAARSLIATEAGGDLYDFIPDSEGHLWIAAGDVAGHGYSCGIQQAMVKASLLSLVKDGQRPSQVLSEIHRVLRSAGRTKLFTTLLLLKIDPRTGQGLLANAGHPFPLRLFEGQCEEIEIPGLPLGQGPSRKYADVEVTLPAGAALVMASDGLFEGLNRLDVPYGYSRAQAVLTAVGLWRRGADGIVEALLSDLELHAKGAQLSDDTTVVVVKRTALAW